MKTNKKSLQKLTDLEHHFSELLKKPKVEIEDIENMSEEELKAFLDFLNKKISVLKAEALDDLLERIDPITTDENKNKMWEHNHNQITWAISVLMQEKGRMPTAHEIATKSELSRQTVHKHLKQYANDSRYLEIKRQFSFMTSKVLARVFRFAVNGDMRAAKLYFEVVGNLGNHPFAGSTTNTQNNYIQINQVRLSQEIIGQLSPQQLGEIEATIKNVLPQHAVE